MLYSYFLGILLCVSGSYSALYDSYSDVVELTPSNFDRLVTHGDEVWLVEFYAPWCGHCKKLVPEYKKTASALKGSVKVGAMDADKHKSFAHTFGVTGFPTIKIFTGKKHIPYKGHRSADDFVDAALKAVKDKAYNNLGRRATDHTSDKQYYPETFGHSIPWKAIQNTPADTPQTVPPQIDQQDTCKPEGLIPNYNKKETTTTKNVRKETKKTTIVTKPTTVTQTVTLPTDKQITESIIDKFRELQSQLFRGTISDTEKPKIIKALMKLKSVLQGRREFVKAPIMRTRLAARKG